jgi:hypothetical protein
MIIDMPSYVPGEKIPEKNNESKNFRNKVFSKRKFENLLYGGAWKLD